MKSMILWAVSTSMPSRFRTTVQDAISVSAISFVSSMVVGRITLTSIGEKLRFFGAAFVFFAVVSFLEEYSLDAPDE